MSFMIIRLLQSFSTIALDRHAQPPESRPPSHWSTSTTGRKAIEQIFPKSHLTMYTAVGPVFLLYIALYLLQPC